MRESLARAIQALPSGARRPIRSSKLADLEAIRALAANCGYNTTALAARLGISIRHLQRLFARQLGCAPRAWLREERMQAAHRLLLRAATIKEVSLALSFRQESHFSRNFRSRFGCTPSALREAGGVGSRGARVPASSR